MKLVSTIFATLSLKLFQNKERGAVRYIPWDLFSGKTGHQSPFLLLVTKLSRERLEESIVQPVEGLQKPAGDLERNTGRDWVLVRREIGI